MPLSLHYYIFGPSTPSEKPMLKQAMYTRILLSLLVFLCSHLPGITQLQPVYAFLQDDTLLKKTYYDQVIKVRDNLLGALDKKKPESKDYKDIYEQQYKEIGALVKSNRTITEATAHKYLQSIVQKIIAANPELSTLQLRVLFTRDWWANASSMGDGTIAFNAGLLILLDNEAEMAFVLCHELAHYYLDHSNKRIRKSVEMLNSETFKAEVKRIEKQEYRAGQQMEELMKKTAFNFRRHGRENEAEADRYAFRFLKNTGFDCNGIITCLHLLDKIDDSLMHKPLVLPDAFQSADYPFKNKWIQKTSSIFSQLDKNDSPLTQKEKDSLKTHPDCIHRIELLKDSIAMIQPGKQFLVDENLFRNLQKELPVEIMEHNYQTGNLDRQLYYALLLLQEEKHVPVAIYSIARTLNDIFICQRDHTLGTKVAKENRFYHEDFNLLLRMLDRIKLDEIANLNYQFCRKYEAKMAGYKGFAEEMEKARTWRNN
jgi:predicted SprT family Zn-dependent metalloprotease